MPPLAEFQSTQTPGGGDDKSLRLDSEESKPMRLLRLSRVWPPRAIWMPPVRWALTHLVAVAVAVAVVVPWVQVASERLLA